MKKLLSVLFLLFIGMAVNAQSCPNGNFESWNTVSYSTIDSGWFTSNPQSLSLNDTLTVWSVPGYISSAIHIQTTIIGIDTDMAFITNSYGDPMQGKGGVPYTQKPNAITGYYRYNLPVNDSAVIIVVFKKSGAIVSTDKFMIRNATGSLATFTAFTYTLSLTIVPDTVIIAAVSSNFFGAGMQSGSWLELDQLSFTGTGITQGIPEGNFDTWIPATLDVPSGWHTQVNFVSGIVKSTDHYQGSYSAELISLPSAGGGGGNTVEAAILTTGKLLNHAGPTGGLPYTQLIDTLNGYYKYLPAGADTAGINISLSQGGFPLSGFGSYLLPATGWTYFEIPFSVSSAPDTVRIDIYSGSWSAALPGSILRIDHLQFKSQPLPSVKVKEINENNNEVYIYPNPVNDQLGFNFKNPVNGKTEITIYDLSGRAIKKEIMAGSKSAISIPVQYLRPGIYFYEVKNNDLILRNKFIKD